MEMVIHSDAFWLTDICTLHKKNHKKLEHFWTNSSSHFMHSEEH